MLKLFIELGRWAIAGVLAYRLYTEVAPVATWAFLYLVIVMEALLAAHNELRKSALTWGTQL